MVDQPKDYGANSSPRRAAVQQPHEADSKVAMPIHATVQTFFSRYPTKLYKKSEVLIQAGDRAPAYYIINGLVVQYELPKTAPN